MMSYDNRIYDYILYDKVKNKFDGYDPKSLHSNVDHPKNMISYIVGILNFYGAGASILGGSDHFNNNYITFERSFGSFINCSMHNEPGWRGSFDISFAQSCKKFFKVGPHKSLYWSDIIQYLLPGVDLRTGAGGEHYAGYSYVVLVNNFVKSKNLFRELKPISLLDAAKSKKQKLNNFWFNWERERLPALLMTHPDAAPLIMLEQSRYVLKREQYLELKEFKDQARSSWDLEYIEQNLKMIDDEYSLDELKLERVIEYFDINLDRWVL